jgi:hypothetical protein
LKGKIGEQFVDFCVNVNSANEACQHGNALPIHRLAAKAEIMHLQDKDKGNKEIVHYS